jgi:hypothetical protein
MYSHEGWKSGCVSNLLIFKLHRTPKGLKILYKKNFKKTLCAQNALTVKGVLKIVRAFWAQKEILKGFLEDSPHGGVFCQISNFWVVFVISELQGGYCNLP